MSFTLPIVTLKPSKERSLKRYHPWVFSGAVDRMPPLLEPGTLVRVQSSQGEPLGVGYTGDGGSIVVKILEFQCDELRPDWLETKLKAAFALRRELELFTGSQTNACRLVHGEGDGLPGLIIDRYADLAVVQIHTQGMLKLVGQIEKLVVKLLSPDVTRVFVRALKQELDDQSKGENNSESNQEQHLVDILENGHKFRLNYSSGQKTGFFLDQRENRTLLKRLAPNRNVLNCFSFSGAFSVYALTGGAQSVVSVDASKSALALCEQNIELNFGSKAAHSTKSADCFKLLQDIKNSYDLIVLDPPAFAKHRGAINSAIDGYRNINRLALQGIKPNGIIFTFSCSQLISRQEFREVVFSASAISGRKVRVLYDLHQGPDHPISIYHPEGEYLKGLVLGVE